MTNGPIASQLAHCTIRAYKDQPLTETEVTTLVDVVHHIATSSFLRACTILHITDSQVHETIGIASGQPYVGGMKGDLFILVTDLYRNSRARTEQDVSLKVLDSVNLFPAALEDALLTAQNVVVVAESMGLGTVYLGSTLTDPRPVMKALELPGLTFPALNLFVGHPNQESGQKPRMPPSVVIAKNTYPCVESYFETPIDYDRGAIEYYDLRPDLYLESFSHLVAINTGAGDTHASPIMEAPNEQGLCLC